MPSAVASASAEITAALAAMVGPHEGLRDFARLNLRPETLVAVRTSIDQYDRRVRLLTAAQQTLDALLADGHPDLSQQDVAAAVLADLKANAESIETALELFAPNTATTLGLAAEPPQGK